MKGLRIVGPLYSIYICCGTVDSRTPRSGPLSILYSLLRLKPMLRDLFMVGFPLTSNPELSFLSSLFSNSLSLGLIYGIYEFPGLRLIH